MIRKDPIWTRIPVPSMVTATRGTTRQERLVREEKKRAEVEKEEKRRKNAEEAARILAQKWAEEDRRRNSRNAAEEDDSRRGQRRVDDEDDRRRRKRDRSDERQDSNRGDHPSSSSSRRITPQEEYAFAHKLDIRHDPNLGKDDTEEQDPEPPQQPGMWQTVANRGKDVAKEQPKDQPKEPRKEVAVAALKKRSVEPPQKTKAVKGAFGVEDSDEDDERSRRELERASQRKRSRVSLPPPQAQPFGAAPSGALGAGSLNDIYRKLSAFKASCKGKWIPMPDDLKEEWARLHGGAAPPM